MGNVYANLMEVSSKSMQGKSICEFPDVCFTPPQTPATPPGVPIPYPNTGMAGDTTEGSRSVSIGGQEVMLKNKSHFKRSMGDDAGCAPKKGLITSTNTGKVYFNAWSMDVKVEGENVVRNLDLTTHNHGSAFATGCAPTVHVATISPDFSSTESCATDKTKMEAACGKDGAKACPGSLMDPVGEQREEFVRKDDLSRTRQAGDKATKEANGSDCTKAMRCMLRPYTPNKKQGGCCPGQSPHHVPPKSMLNGKIKGYSDSSALCVCLEGASQHVGSHGENHAAIDHMADKLGVKNKPCTLGKYNEVCAIAVAQQCGCEVKCIQDQLDQQFEGQLDKEVKHWQSNSKALSSGLETKLDKAFDALPKSAKAG